MKAVLKSEDNRLIWADTPDPVVGDDQVLIEIHETALNRADLLQREGLYMPPPDWPDRYGLEAAGVVRAMGTQASRAGRFHIGDKVCALLGSGGHAEYAAVPEGLLMPVPEGLSLREAAALPEIFAAAYLFLCVEARVKSGETVLVTAGASGLAGAVVPLAKLLGARVITTVRGRRHIAEIGYLQADKVIDTQTQSLEGLVKEEKAAGYGIDICIDCLGGIDAGRCLKHMNRGGRWLIIASLAGDSASVDLRSMYGNNTRLMGVSLRSRPTEEKAALLSEMTKLVWPRIETGTIRPHIRSEYPIHEIEKAHAEMASGSGAGKILLKVR